MQIGSTPSLADAVPDSSVFVTTLVASCLHEVEGPAARSMRERAVDFIEAEMEVGGLWRYYSSRQYKHTRLPPDLDDTACATFALRQAGRRPVDNGWIFRERRDGKGRFLTWVTTAPFPRASARLVATLALGDLAARRSRERAPAPTTFTDPRLRDTLQDVVCSDEADPVVNANIVLLLGETAQTQGAVDDLLRTVPTVERGGFSAYYPDPLILFHAVSRAFRNGAPSLAALRGPVTLAIRDRARTGKLSGSPLALALAATTLLNFESDAVEVAELLRALIPLQAHDGSWAAETFYAGPTEFWGSSELTTALCLEALARSAPKTSPGPERDVGSLKGGLSKADLRLISGPGGVDEAWYRARHPEVKTHPAAHYGVLGWREGRDPNPDFCTTWYLANNPDVAAAGMAPLAHYLRDGRSEGRASRPGPAGGVEVLHGPEGVDADWYRARYRDVDADPATHYATHGWREGRDPNRRFSTRWYLATNPDVVEVGMNPLLHYFWHGRAEGRHAWPTLGDTLRLRAWWPGKILPVVVVALATALHAHVPLSAVAVRLGALALAVAACAAYASLINDVSDVDADAAARKRNPVMALGRVRSTWLLIASIACGAAWCASVWPDALAVGLYAAIWIVFALYSLRPVRLKARGGAGVWADALGAHGLPALLAVLVPLRASGGFEPAWAALVAAWALCLGLRSIITHQLVDAAADARAAAPTFVRRYGRSFAEWLVDRLLLPMEIVCLALVLLGTGSALVVGVSGGFALAACVALTGERAEARGTLGGLMAACYGAVLPISVLAAASLTGVRDLLVAAGVGLVFWAPLRSELRNLAVFFRSRLAPAHPTFRRHG